MRKVLFILALLLCSYGIFASPFTDALKDFIGKKVDVWYTFQVNWAVERGVILADVNDDAIIIEIGDKKVFINRIYLVKIELKK